MSKATIPENVRQQLIIRQLQIQKLAEEMRITLQTFLDTKELEGVWQASDDYSYVEKIEDGEGISK